MKKPFTLAIIPARGGSKGIPKKNLRLLNGKPLIGYPIETALLAKGVSDFIVTSDAGEILEAATKCGAKNVVKRPAELAADASPTADPVLHALAHYEKEKGVTADYILLLQATAPLCRAQDVEAAIVLMKKHPDADTLISCYDATHVHPSIMYRREKGDHGARIWPGDAVKRRQNFEPVFVRNGAIYLAKRDYLIANGRLHCDSPLLFVMPRSRSVNIDEELDFHLAETILKFGSDDL